MSLAPIPARRQSDAHAVGDALRYPWASDALITNVALTLSQIVVGYLPLIGIFLQLVVWASAYRYALEVMTASGQGRRDPPQGALLTDASSARSHLWLHALVVIGLVAAANLLGPVSAMLLLVGAALVLPGALLALAAAQNLLAAFNPAAWIAVLRIVGPAYFLLSLGIGLTLLLQLSGERLFGALRPEVLGDLLYFFAVHAALFASFRLIGTRLHQHAVALGLEQASVARPVLTRDRELQAVAREASAAAGIEDPAAKAAALDPLIRRGGASEELHREYRRCLRASRNAQGLRQHAEVRVCELLVLRQPKPALALAAEAYADDPTFALPDAPSTAALLDAADASAQLRAASAIARNYRNRFPKRYDGLALALRTATLLADRLGEAASAEALLQASVQLAGNGPEAAEFERLLRRLRSGLPLSDTAAMRRPPP